MENLENDIDDLIGKVLAREATAAEWERVNSWCRESNANRQYFEHAKAIFEQASTLRVKLSFDTDKAWQKVRAQLRQEPEEQELHIEGNVRDLWPVARIAAGIAFLLAASVWTYQWVQQPASSVAVVADATTAQDTLPDGTTAFLNRKSSITFEFDKKTQTRKVELKGEGFFEVKHEEEKPFVIEAEETLVRDLGTAFNVKAYPGEDTVEVVVQSGIVQFYTKDDPGLSLNAGETGIYSKRTRSFTRLARADTNVFAYKTGVFAFHSTDLRSVVEKINDVYESHIKLDNDKIGDCLLTVNFNHEQLDTIVDVIAETLSLEVERKGKNEIVLKGPGCQ